MLFLLLLIGLTVGHYLSYNRAKSEEILSAVSTLSQISSPSLSVAYYEPRLLIFDRVVNPSYPEMTPINRMDFIYEKQ